MYADESVTGWGRICDENNRPRKASNGALPSYQDSLGRFRPPRLDVLGRQGVEMLTEIMLRAPQNNMRQKIRLLHERVSHPIIYTVAVVIATL